MYIGEMVLRKHTIVTSLALGHIKAIWLLKHSLLVDIIMNKTITVYILSRHDHNTF